MPPLIYYMLTQIKIILKQNLTSLEILYPLCYHNFIGEIFMINPIKRLKEQKQLKNKKLYRDSLIKSLNDKFNIKDTETKTTDELELIYSFLEYEKNFLESKKDTVFDFFGYFGFNDNELPAFFEKTNSSDNLSIGSFHYPVTPKILSHCVNNLTIDEKLKIFANFGQFKEMCKQLEDNSKYKEEPWEPTIQEICKSLKYTWTMTKLKYCDQITVDDLKQIDWSEFGKEIKPYLTPSYNSKPSNVEYRQNKNGTIDTILTFRSKTGLSYRKLIIPTDIVYQAVNTDVEFLQNEEMTRVWKPYYLELLINSINKTNQKESEEESQNN